MMSSCRTASSVDSVRRTAKPTRLDAAAWPAVAAVADRSLLAIPLGSTEQHGPHLAFTTDTDIAVALAEALAGRRHDVIVAPPLCYGSSGEHATFAGTLSIGSPAFEQVVVELVRSADVFCGVVLISAHGGNAHALASAIATLHYEGRRVLAWSPLMHTGDAHAGHSETSIMLALRPDAVDVEAAEVGDIRPIEILLPQLQASGVASVAPNGVLGDPTQASLEEGRVLLRALEEDLVGAVERWVR
jgi:mycofactocin precursor peptide peptidase